MASSRHESESKYLIGVTALLFSLCGCGMRADHSVKVTVLDPAWAAKPLTTRHEGRTIVL
jgi:hypothetical protein